VDVGRCIAGGIGMPSWDAEPPNTLTVVGIIVLLIPPGNEPYILPVVW
jgi:hypothetical protein